MSNGLDATADGVVVRGVEAQFEFTLSLVAGTTQRTYDALSVRSCYQGIEAVIFSYDFVMCLGRTLKSVTMYSQKYTTFVLDPMVRRRPSARTSPPTL